MNPITDQKEFAEKVAKKNPDIELVGTYTGLQNDVEAQCRKCGYRFTRRAATFKNTDCKCPKCSRKEKFTSKLAAEIPEFTLEGDYAGSTTPVLVRCSCGETHSAVPVRILRHEAPCPACGAGGKEAVKSAVITEKHFMQELAEKQPEIAVEGKFTSKTSPVAVVCYKHNWHGEVTPLNIPSKKRLCPFCHKEQKNREFIRRLTEVSPEITPLELGDPTSREKILVRCDVCDKTWLVAPFNLIYNKTKCPNCRKKKMMKQDEDKK